MKNTNILTTGIISDLTQVIRKLPGLGTKSALKIALHLAIDESNLKKELTNLIEKVDDTIESCQACGMICYQGNCQICSDQSRDTTKLCLLEKIQDVFAIENSSSFKGHYFIIKNQISDFSDNEIKNKLFAKISSLNNPEIILALSMTIESQVACNYIKKIIAEFDNSLKISRLAFGIPAGGDIEYLDDGTIFAAFKGRTKYII